MLAAFVPLVLVTGLAGRLFQPFGLTFTFVLLLSLLLSLTLIPLAAAPWISTINQKPAGDTLGARYIHWVGDWNLRLLDHLLRHRGKTIAVTVLLFLASMALLTFTRNFLARGLDAVNAVCEAV